MKTLSEILAKSKNYGSLTLLEHTQQVSQAIEFFAQNYDWEFEVAITRKGAILHDLGKAHPHFQRKIQEANGESLADERNWDYPHRHEISSLGFLSLFPEKEWSALIDLVVGHHKSILKDPSERGILDLIEKDPQTISNHLLDWDDWHRYGLLILEEFGVKTHMIPYQEAESNLKWVVAYCRDRKKGWSPLRGLLRSADHFASAFTHDTGAKLKHLFEVPDLAFYRDVNRTSDLYPLSQIRTDDPRPHTLVVAPTGAGKTDFLLKRTRGRIFYTLPFQASINAMWERIKSNVPNKDIRLLHATSKIVAKGKVDEQILQPMPGSAVKVLTPHQLAAIVFGTSGFETVMLDVKGTDVILDEIHTYSDFSRSMVLEIVKALLRLDCRLHIGTATMPSVLYQELKEILGGEKAVYEINLPDSVLDTFDRHVVFKMEEEEFSTILHKAFHAKEKVLVVCNTVKKAQEMFAQIKEEFPHVPNMLIHSRFKRGDRVKLETKLKTEFNGDGKKWGDGLTPCVAVSTQVVEVSLDISFDRMITYCAPLDGMIQRFGRVNRKRSKDTIGTYKPVHVIRPKGSVLPYKLEILQASLDQLPEEGGLLKERSLQNKIDAVFPTLDTKVIDIHLICDNGRYKIKELTNHKKAVLIEALEIESASCILESDREFYETAKWEDRLPLEIPISWRSISRYASLYNQLEIGSYPFVIPQPEAEYEQWGLQLVEPSNLI
jgi:CRISPR-associated endonuclease/helicase Cas3